MAYKALSLIQQGQVAFVTLGRPRRGNRISLELSQELREVCQHINQDDAIRVAVLTGQGRSFCRGSEGDWLPRSREWAQRELGHHQVSGALAGVTKPLVAAINGDALDQGLELALACDLRIASRRARLGLTQVARGFLPWDGGTQRLPRIVGRAAALDLLLTARIIAAREALDMGLVNAVAGPEEVQAVAQRVAEDIAGKGPVAARYAKETVWKGMDLTLEQALRLEADLNFILQSTHDRAEGIRSFLERRRPDYRGE